MNLLEDGKSIDVVTGYLSEKVSTMMKNETKTESLLFRTLMLESFANVYFVEIVKNYDTAVRQSKGVCVKCLR